MKGRRWIPAALLSFLGACNYTDGQCWLRSEDGAGAGAGGGVVGPYGVGGYGDEALEPQATGDGPPPDCVEIGTYPASLFKFSTLVADDGKDLGGGYQTATALAKFVDGRQEPPASWSCSVTVGMPLRTAKFGKVSAAEAGEISADVLTTAASVTMHSKDSWLRALFCRKLADNMNALFAKQYAGLGASASAQ